MFKHLPMLVLVGWLFEPGVRDILEYQTKIGGAWTDAPGPYSLVNGEYNVRVPNDTQMKLFRVRRWWGDPYLLGLDRTGLTPTGVTKTNARISKP